MDSSRLPFAAPLPLLAACLALVIGSLLPAPALRAQERAPDAPGDLNITSDVRRDGEIFTVSVSAELAVTRARAWSVLTDYERYAEFIPEIDASRVVSRTPGGLVLEQKGRMSFLFFSQPVEVRLAVIESPPSQVASRSIGGSLRDFSGRYLIAETPGGVRIEHTARFVPEFDLPPLLGPIIVRSVLERNFVALLQEMQRRAAPQGRAVPASPTN